MKKHLMYGTLGIWAVTSLLSAAPAEQRFEAENVLVNSDVLQPNTSRKGVWNLWSTDKDAEKKWSEGVVIQGNPITENCKPDEVMPVLRFRIPVAEAGVYDLGLTVTRSVGVSVDGGKNWFRHSGNTPVIRARKVEAGGAMELQVAANYVHPDGAGSPYIDYFTLMPVARVNLLKNGGFESGEPGKTPANWTLWARDAESIAAVAAEGGRSGTRSARITATGTRDWAFTGSTVNVKPGETFEVTCFAKNNGEDSPHVELQVSSYKDGKVFQFSMASRKLDTLSKEWGEYRLKFTVPAGVDRVSVRLIGNGKADISVDDLSMLPAEPAAESAVKAGPPKGIGPRKVEGFAATRVREKFDRGLVALPLEHGGVYLSWRLLESDAPGIGFDVFSISGGKEEKLNASPVVQTTDFTVAAPKEGARYAVRPAAGFAGVAGTADVVPNPEERNPFLSLKLSDPTALVNKVGIGDLNGDGKYDYVVRYGNANVDPWHLFWKPSKQPFTLEAVTGDGKTLWTKNLGWNIESGIWYAPYVVYDVNGDGRAEVILKASAPDAGDLREKEGEDAGKVMTGEEFLMVLDGETGKEIARAPWPSRDHFLGQKWAYNYYSRNQLAIAYLDGKTPCIIALRGTYGLMLAEAWQLKDGKLEALWTYTSAAHGRNYHGQGAHTTRAIDLDGDGRDEIVLGGAVLDDDGSPLWSTGHGHPDYVYVTDITPNNPGLEVVTVYETATPNGGGFTCADAKTGKVLWALDKPATHIHYGYGGDIDPRYRGWEIGGSDTSGGEAKNAVDHRHYSPDGELLRFREKAPYTGTEHFAYWDADLQRELVRPIPLDFDGGPAGGSYGGKFLMQADVFGDWREELLTVQRGELRIYSTVIPAMDRRVTLMQDPDYRMTIVANAMGYIYDPALSYLPTSVSPNLNLTFMNGDKGAMLRVVVSAPLDSGLKGTLKLSSDRKMTFGRNEIAIDLKAGGLETFEIPIERPFPPYALIRGALTLENGTVLRGQVPTGVKPPVPIKVAGIVTEAEDFVAETGGKVVIRTDKSGVSGKCFSHWDKPGHGLTWKLKVPKTGKYQIALRYSCVEDASRQIIVNGQDYGTFVFPGTGGFGDSAADWDMFKVGRGGGQQIFSLEQGEAELRIVNVTGSMNLDCIELIPVP